MRLSKEQDITADLQAHNIKISSQQLDKFMKSFDQYLNPFSQELPKDQLFNIASGKAATSNVEEFLLNVEKIGGEQRELFLLECSSYINRFDKTIKKTPVHNFASQIEKKEMCKSMWEYSGNQDAARPFWPHVRNINGS